MQTYVHVMTSTIELGDWKRHRNLELTIEEWREVEKRRKQQEAIFGRNNGTFVAKKDKNYTGVGVAGEIAARHYLTEAFGLPEGSATLTEVGGKRDINIRIPSEGLEFSVHVKTGAYRNWPARSLPFGIHADQGIQHSGSALILVFLRRLEGSAFGREAQIAGWIPPWHLGECEVVEKGEMFPGGKYPSKTRNIVTYVRDYLPLTNLRELAGPHPPHRPADLASALA